MSNPEEPIRPVDIVFPEAGRLNALRTNACVKTPIGCGKNLLLSPIERNFRDTLSLKEYYISGLCQECQDLFFTDELPEDNDEMGTDQF